MTWWLLVTLVSLLALVFLVPAFRRHGRVNPGTAASRLAVYQDRLRELENDFAAGTLDRERYEEAREELEGAAALDLDDARETGEGPDSMRWPTVAVIVILVPVLAIALYSQLGEAPHSGDGDVAAMDGHDFDELIARLAARMDAHPDDVDGWMLLGRSYMMLGDYDAAARAWREAYRLEGEHNATVLANLGEVLAVTTPDGLAGEAGLLFERALALEPENTKALFYGGMLAFEEGDRERASERWRRLLAQDPPPELREVIEERLGEATGFAVEVGISDELQDRLSAGATLFVSARDTTAGDGPPLAAVRREGLMMLPVRVTLSDASLMIPGMSLLEADELVLTARVTTGAGVERRPGDLVGEAHWRRDGGETARVILNRVVQ